MSPRTIQIETELPTSAGRVWEAMKHPVSFLYVIRGLAGFPALAGRTDPIRPGEVGTGWLLAFHLIPLHRHTIEVIDVDEQSLSVITSEHGGVVKRWDHTLHVEPVSDTTCHYSDTVVVDAGFLTGFVCVVATAFYRYRQRRWLRLVRKHLLANRSPFGRPTGEGHSI